MHHQVLLRRDSTLESLDESYRRYFQTKPVDDESESGTEFTPANESGGMAPPTDIRDFPPIVPVAGNTEDSTKKAKQNHLLILIIALTFSIGTAGAVGAVVYGRQIGAIIGLKWLGNVQDTREAILDPTMLQDNMGMLSIFKRTNDFPASYKVFAESSDPILANDRPVFFDLPGTGASFISSALSKCLGLTAASVSDNDEKQSRKLFGKFQADFMTTESLCRFSRQFDPSERARIFMLIRNPAVRSVLSYFQKQDKSSPKYDELVEGMTFDEYINSTLFERNHLTRSILCKNKGDLNKKDLELAKNFLRDKCTVGMFQDYSNAFNMFQEKFGWFRDKFDVDKCVAQEFRQSLLEAESYTNFGKNINDYMEALNDANDYDMQLYSIANTL